jgi:hypothetical protein
MKITGNFHQLFLALKIPCYFCRPTSGYEYKIIFGGFFLIVKNIVLFSPTLPTSPKLIMAAEKHSISCSEGHILSKLQND